MADQNPGGADPKEEALGEPDVDDLLSESFDDDILGEIEERLDGDGPVGAGDPAGEKVELDKADLPIWEPDAEEEEPPLKEDKPPPAPEPVMDMEVEPPDLEDEEAPPQSPLKKHLPKVAAGLLAIGLAAGIGVWYSSGPKKPLAQPEKRDRPGVVRGVVPNPELALKLNLKPFIVPLTKSKAGSILRVAVSLEMADSLAKMKVAQKKRLCRDVIYRLLRYRPADEMRSPRSRGLLRSQIKTELNHALGANSVAKVYFTQFLITG